MNVVIVLYNTICLWTDLKDIFFTLQRLLCKGEWPATNNWKSLVLEKSYNSPHRRIMVGKGVMVAKDVHGSGWVGLRRFFDPTHMGWVEPMVLTYFF